MAESDRWEYRRSRHTASSPSRDFDSLVVTHPFHPLSGQQVVILFERRYKSIGLVYVCDGGALGNVSLPERFTDRGLAPDKGPLNGEILAELRGMVSALRKRLDTQRGGE